MAQPDDRLAADRVCLLRHRRRGAAEMTSLLAHLADLGPGELDDFARELAAGAPPSRRARNRSRPVRRAPCARERPPRRSPSRLATPWRTARLCGPSAAAVPAAPNSWTTATRPRAARRRSRWRVSSASQTASLPPNVIGTAGWACVRPGITVARCSSALAATSSPELSDEGLDAIQCAARRRAPGRCP